MEIKIHEASRYSLSTSNFYVTTKNSSVSNAVDGKDNRKLDQTLSNVVSFPQFPKCNFCKYFGHNSDVHKEEDYQKRYDIIQSMGWKPFKNWFIECDFRNWWQLCSFSGVPLYKIYTTSNGTLKVWNTRKPRKLLGFYKEEQLRLRLTKLNSKDVFNNKRLSDDLKTSYELLLPIRISNTNPDSESCEQLFPIGTWHGPNS